MHEINGIPRAASKLSWLIGAGLLLLGVILGRTLFPLEVPTPFIVEKRVEVPVERIVEKQVPFEVIKYVDRVVAKRVEVPVVKVVERRFPLPIESFSESRASTPIDRAIVKLNGQVRDVNSLVNLPFSALPWKEVQQGMSGASVRGILGEPARVFEGVVLNCWCYGDSVRGGRVWFFGDQVHSYDYPTR